MDLVGLYNSITGNKVGLKDPLYDDIRTTMKEIRNAKSVKEAADHFVLTMGCDEQEARDFAKVARTRMRVHV